MPRRHHGACLGLTLACLWGGAVAASETTLDLALVLAVAYVEWSGADEQTVLVPWTVIDGPDAARTVASELKRQPIRQGAMTSISGVIGFSMRLFADLADRPARRVIDISGDGPNNDGPKVRYVRDYAVAEGITINGLPV